MKVFPIVPADLWMWWAGVKPFIEEAQETSAYYTPDDVYDALINGRSVLWLVWDGNIKAVCVTTIVSASKNKACSIWIMDGRGADEWEDLVVETTEAYARGMGCTMMRHEARPAYQRRLKSKGYKLSHVILEKALP